MSKSDIDNLKAELVAMRKDYAELYERHYDLSARVERLEEDAAGTKRHPIKSDTVEEPSHHPRQRHSIATIRRSKGNAASEIAPKPAKAMKRTAANAPEEDTPSSARTAEPFAGLRNNFLDLNFFSTPRFVPPPAAPSTSRQPVTKDDSKDTKTVPKATKSRKVEKSNRHQRRRARDDTDGPTQSRNNANDKNAKPSGSKPKSAKRARH